MDPAPTCFPLQLIIPKGWPPSSTKSIYIFDIGRREWLPDPIEGLGDVLLQPQYQHGVEPFLFQMDGNKLASVWCYPYFPIAQQSSSPQPAQPSTDQPIFSVLQSSHDIGSKTRKSDLVQPDILENAALEKFDGVDKHVSKKLQVDKLSQVSSSLSTTRLQEFVSAHNEAVKKLQDEAEKPKELNSSLVSKLKDSVERDSKSFVKLFTAYYLEGFKDCKAKGRILCPHAEWDEVQPNQLED
ncbi:hypothetical protein C1H46_019394 [Malus baccata]|uniref:Uncharacterized protein n=1 Tax=Malus baccata TaxID=106549 RepID=A0A540M870_MALBA|nr:hypothetical protein C1H46_019394 [Malus baccata]